MFGRTKFKGGRRGPRFRQTLVAHKRPKLSPVYNPYLPNTWRERFSNSALLNTFAWCLSSVIISSYLTEWELFLLVLVLTCKPDDTSYRGYAEYGTLWTELFCKCRRAYFQRFDIADMFSEYFHQQSRSWFHQVSVYVGFASFQLGLYDLALFRCSFLW